jgi:hypothetical protein
MLQTLGVVLLRVAGFLLILAGVAAAWLGSGQQDAMRGQEATVVARQDERGRTLPVAEADRQIAEARATLNGLERRMYFWYGAAAAFVILGVVLVVSPLRGQRKAPVAEAPPP